MDKITISDDNYELTITYSRGDYLIHRTEGNKAILVRLVSTLEGAFAYSYIWFRQG